MNDIERETAIELFEWLEKEHPLIMSYGVGIEALKMVGQIEAMKAEINELERFELRGTKTSLVNVDNVLKIIDRFFGGKTDENTD